MCILYNGTMRIIHTHYRLLLFVFLYIVTCFAYSIQWKYLGWDCTFCAVFSYIYILYFCTQSYFKGPGGGTLCLENATETGQSLRFNTR